MINNPDELTAFIGQVKITFLSYPFPIVEPFVLADRLPMLPVKEIGATKAYTIGRRGTYKDYVDLYFIIAEKHASLQEIITLAEQKFGREFNSRLFTEQLLFMDDVRNHKIDFLKVPVTPAGIAAFFRDKIRELFVSRNIVFGNITCVGTMTLGALWMRRANPRRGARFQDAGEYLHAITAVVGLPRSLYYEQTKRHIVI